MNPDPRVRRGAHRTSRAASATLLPSLLAILAVTSLITALYVWRGEDPKTPPAAASAGTHNAADSTAPTTPPPSAVATAEKTTAPPATTSAPPTHKPKKSRPADLRSELAIVVLNETSRSGLAATASARLKAKGWSVTGVGNFRGAVPLTTVYYPVGHQDAALAAAKNLPTTPRIRPRFGNLSTTRLTVVVANDYPS